MSDSSWIRLVNGDSPGGSQIPVVVCHLAVLSMLCE